MTELSHLDQAVAARGMSPLTDDALTALEKLYMGK